MTRKERRETPGTQEWTEYMHRKTKGELIDIIRILKLHKERPSNQSKEETE